MCKHFRRCTCIEGIRPTELIARVENREHELSSPERERGMRGRRLSPVHEHQSETMRSQSQVHVRLSDHSIMGSRCFVQLRMSFDYVCFLSPLPATDISLNLGCIPEGARFFGIAFLCLGHGQPR